MVKASGRGTVQSPFTLAFWLKPPQWSSPIPQPLTTTELPTGMSSRSHSETVPAKSIPGTMGHEPITGNLFVIANPSL